MTQTVLGPKFLPILTVFLSIFLIQNLNFEMTQPKEKQQSRLFNWESVYQNVFFIFLDLEELFFRKNTPSAIHWLGEEFFGRF